MSRRAMVGSPLGHTAVSLDGARCCAAAAASRRARRPGRADRGPTRLRIRRPAAPRSGARYLPRCRPGRPARARAGAARAARGAVAGAGGPAHRPHASADLDSALARRVPRPPGAAAPLRADRGQHAGRSDAADVIPSAPASGRIRYAVSLRQRRVLGGRRYPGQRPAVMVWDSAGAWRQDDLPPHPARLRSAAGSTPSGRRPAGLLAPAAAHQRLRLSSGQYLDGAGRRPRRQRAWGIIQPRANVVVAAAEVEGACGVKIYTRTGDTGETALFGGGRVPKDHPRVAAYGDVDELNSAIGVARATAPAELLRPAAGGGPARPLRHRRPPRHAGPGEGGEGAGEGGARRPERVDSSSSG